MTFEHDTNKQEDITQNGKLEIFKNGHIIRSARKNSLNALTPEADHKIQQTAKRTLTRKKTCCTIVIILLGTIAFIVGILMVRYTLFDIFMQERLRMTPGFPPFEWWRQPKPEVLLRAYIFTVTNADEFLEGEDDKLKLREFGPIVYRERLEHTDVEFHENSTLSYTIHRHVEFLPERNRPGILNETIIVPNIVLLGMATVVDQWGFGAKIAFRLVSATDSVFINTTVYNYLWNATTPALDAVKPLLPSFLVPQDNGGALHNVYKHFTDRVNVRIGKEHGFEQFFMINTFNGRPTVPGFIPERGDCLASLVNSTEGALYPSFLSKNDTIYYWRKTACRPIPLIFAEEVQKGAILAYKFEAQTSLYDRFKDPREDCYKYRKDGILPNGLSDISKCYNNMPVVISAPHFYGRTGFWNDQLEGFTPNKKDHGSFAIIEPVLGVPIEQVARSQSNMYMPKMYGFNSHLQKFSERIIPMIWIEYHQEKLTPIIDAMIIFTVNVLPVLQYIICAAHIIAGAAIALLGIKQLLQIDYSLSLFGRRSATTSIEVEPTDSR